MTTGATNQEFEALYQALATGLQQAKAAGADLPKAAVELPFEHPKEMALLFLGFICYFAVDRDARVLRLMAATDNEYYTQAVADYDFAHNSFEVPLSATDNSMVKAALSGEVVGIPDWDAMRRPSVDEGIARLNQATSGIAYSAVAPAGPDAVIGFNFYLPKEEQSECQETFIQRYCALVAETLSQG